MKRVGALTGFLLLCVSQVASGQSIVTSARPDKVAITVYRSDGAALNLRWLEGFAMVSETRRVSLPAGDVDLRFEGVTAGIIPQSAIVTGLGDSLVEKNRDAMLLSPGTLLSAMLGQRVHLKRTNKATGTVVEQDAVLRSGPNGVVLQTPDGFEALRCSGMSETIRAGQVPPTLSARPTLSSRLRLTQPVETTVTLTYLTNNFDWRAHYVGTLAPDGRTMSLFAWLTMANGDETSLADADAMAVAGKLNRERVNVPDPEVRPITLDCWPSGTTSDIDEDMAYADPPPPAPPPPPMAASPVVARMSEEIVVTANRVMAKREALGDLKLYRIPIPVTVAAKSQKQVALLEQPVARFREIARFDVGVDNSVAEPGMARRILLFDNRTDAGLGLPLPAGRFTLFTERAGKPFLLGEGNMTDRAVGERIEVPVDQPSTVRMTQRQLAPDSKNRDAEIVLTNDSPAAVTVEVRFYPGQRVEPHGARIATIDGRPVWTLTLPGNASRTLRYRWRNPD